MTSRRRKTTLRGSRVRVERFVVVCTRHDGREREWMRYDDRDEAQRIAEHLSSIGCLSRVLDTKLDTLAKIIDPQPDVRPNDAPGKHPR